MWEETGPIVDGRDEVIGENMQQVLKPQLTRAGLCPDGAAVQGDGEREVSMMNNQAWALPSASRTPGLAEMYWALKDHGPKRDDRSEAAYRAVVERCGEPTLLVGAASGGLLIDLIGYGYQVDALEPSAIMRAYLVRQALERKLRLTIYGVPMEQMNLDREYSSILVPYGTMMLLTDRRRVLRALRAIFHHLRPGGALAFNVELPASLLGGSESLLGGARTQPTQLKASDDTSLVAERRFLSLDPVDQTYTEQRVYRLCQGRKLVRQEYRTVRQRWYSRHEMAMMLAWAGFGEVDVVGLGSDFTQPVRADQVSMLMFTAHK
jgi:SAM-dependent methyltransferase